MFFLGGGWLGGRVGAFPVGVNPERPLKSWPVGKVAYLPTLFC